MTECVATKGITVVYKRERADKQSEAGEKGGAQQRRVHWVASRPHFQSGCGRKGNCGEKGDTVVKCGRVKAGFVGSLPMAGRLRCPRSWEKHRCWEALAARRLKSAATGFSRKLHDRKGVDRWVS